MDLYIFGSVNLTNIWAGIGAGMWAISLQQAKNVRGATEKAATMPIGALGLIYCSATHSFTTPFLVGSSPTERTIEDVWPEPWTLPFRILPLGTPRKHLPKSDVATTLPTLRSTGRQWNHVLLVSPTTVFVPSKVDAADWEAIIIALASHDVPSRTGSE